MRRQLGPREPWKPPAASPNLTAALTVFMSASTTPQWCSACAVHPQSRLSTSSDNFKLWPRPADELPYDGAPDTWTSPATRRLTG